MNRLHSSLSRDGGIGIRTGLKIPGTKVHEGSIPSRGTFMLTKKQVADYLIKRVIDQAKSQKLDWVTPNSIFFVESGFTDAIRVYKQNKKGSKCYYIRNIKVFFEAYERLCQELEQPINYFDKFTTSGICGYD